MYKRKLKHKVNNAIVNAKHWIKRNTVANHGIVITSKQRRIYQEVTGYYIPTLLQNGMVSEAINYAKWLCKVQQPSGAWLSFDLKSESIFNTGQVLRGLVAIYDLLPEVKNNMLRGADWLISYISTDGRLAPVEGTTFIEGVNSELIHVYCLPPLCEISQKTGIKIYKEYAKRSLKYYKRTFWTDIINFNYLSHFYAYVIEAMADLGENKIAEAAMKKIKKIQRVDGSVPAYKNVHWVCSTGLLQFAVIWFKLGYYKEGYKALKYAISLQNKSGGWYGGYAPHKLDILSNLMREQITYFPNEEISWAVKYFFDAIYYKEKLENELKN